MRSSQVVQVDLKSTDTYTYMKERTQRETRSPEGPVETETERKMMWSLAEDCLKSP